MVGSLDSLSPLLFLLKHFCVLYLVNFLLDPKKKKKLLFSDLSLGAWPYKHHLLLIFLLVRLQYEHHFK